MELTSIVRRIDDLGRFVLPVDIRRKLNINPGDSLEMSFSSDSIQLKKISSIQNLIPLAQLIIKTLYIEYNNLCAIESENKILYSVKKKKEDSHSFPIISNDNIVGHLLVYEYDKKNQALIDFIILIFNKYLEEQG